MKTVQAFSGRWVFPCALGLFAFVHWVKILGIIFPPCDPFAHRFMSLPLT